MYIKNINVSRFFDPLSKANPQQVEVEVVVLDFLHLGGEYNQVSVATDHIPGYQSWHTQVECRLSMKQAQETGTEEGQLGLVWIIRV